jgi:predicted Ser/Thr protein kinase
VQQLAWLPWPQLQLGRTLSQGRHALVQEGTYQGRPAIIKVLNVEGWQPQNSFMWEATVYKAAVKCQEEGFVPTLYGQGLTFGGKLYFMALSPAPGVLLSQLQQPYPPGLQEAVVRALQALHQAGVLHGDLHAGNVMVQLRPGSLPHVTLLDLGHALLGCSGCAMDREMQLLRRLVGPA